MIVISRYRFELMGDHRLQFLLAVTHQQLRVTKIHVRARMDSLTAEMMMIDNDDDSFIHSTSTTAYEV